MPVLKSSAYGSGRPVRGIVSPPLRPPSASSVCQASGAGLLGALLGRRPNPRPMLRPKPRSDTNSHSVLWWAIPCETHGLNLSCAAPSASAPQPAVAAAPTPQRRPTTASRARFAVALSTARLACMLSRQLSGFGVAPCTASTVEVSATSPVAGSSQSIGKYYIVANASAMATTTL